VAIAIDDRRSGTLAAVRIAEHALASLVGAFDADHLVLSDVTDVWSAFDRIERLAVSAKLLLAARIEEAGVWRRAGARSPAEHLAKLGGTSTSVARRSIENAKQVATLPRVADAIRAGGLSGPQVDAIVPAAAADPVAQGRLLELAQSTNVTELREECLRTKAAADPDPDATHARIHENRACRTYADAEGAWNLSARGTAEQGAAFETKMEPIIDELYAKARAEGRREPREAYAFDALMLLGDGDVAPDKKKSGTNPRYLAILHVDLEAIVRGWTEGDELCEIPGLGPIPVRVARELLGDAILKLVITKGVDVMNVTHLGRGATAAQRIALLWSKPKCANVACSSTFTQIDHREPWATTKHTRLDELDPLCPHDHKLKTNQGWSLVEGTGRRAFVGSNDPRHPRNKPPP
jgi:hypothetical protein